MEKIEKILFNGLEGILNQDDFHKKQKEILSRARNKIIQDINNNRITWKRVIGERETFTAEVIVQDGRDEEINLPATLKMIYFSGSDETQGDYYPGLYLGNEFTNKYIDVGNHLLLTDASHDSDFEKINKEIFKLPQYIYNRSEKYIADEKWKANQDKKKSFSFW